ncbi:flavin-containing monooxygenase [Gordonia rubripertincta]|uniref:flavin-containing monooxygenase n=1 Tax=Gordonia rubripertincta TaxID=36822 RepID=UPI000B8DA31F|nr:NAD(P)/FAD-dependent oxidoreductase [Gordonia rubripertincta]ASR01705.1 dihydropyrimidine dehydrogenase subunit A [Gordonia rubripertincta]
MTLQDTTIDAPHAAASATAQESIRLLGYGRVGNLIAPTEGTDHDVLVIGAGQTGLAVAFALRRAGVERVSIVDAGAGEDDLAWRTRARNLTLRTPKTISGPELGIPALSFRAWYESRHGAEAFDAIGRIAISDWADYISWYREQIDVEIRRSIRVESVTPIGAGRVQVTLSAADDPDARPWTEVTRKLVLATGVSGTGGPQIPEVVAGLSGDTFAHTADEIDFGALRGKSVAVLGAAASAFDAAAVALESGAANVHVYTRRSELVVAGDNAPGPNPLVQDVFHLLPDEERWRLRYETLRNGASVPTDSVDRAAAFGNYHLHVDAPWHSAVELDGRVAVTAADGGRVFDFVIAGTGYQQDPATRPELASIADRIALWRDVYDPPAGLESELLARTPYLGAGHEFVEREHGSSPGLSDIHVFSIGANVSFGRPVGDIPSLRVGVPLVAQSITRDLVLADLARKRSAPAEPTP